MFEISELGECLCSDIAMTSPVEVRTHFESMPEPTICESLAQDVKQFDSDNEVDTRDDNDTGQPPTDEVAPSTAGSSTTRDPPGNTTERQAPTTTNGAHATTKRQQGHPLSATAQEWTPQRRHGNQQHQQDELQLLIEAAADRFRNATSWREYISGSREPRGDFDPEVHRLDHPAAHLLCRLRATGAPVCLTTKPWSPGQKRAALERGPHQSAKQHTDFLREEFVGMINKGHWTVLPAHLMAHELWIRLSPLGVVPQRDWRPRTICDYTFFGINPQTLPLAPQEAMQFGRALQRSPQRMLRSHPRHGPVFTSKIDIADGFYRIWIKAEDAPKLAVLFPSRPGEEALIAMPNVLPMGWRESPPYFSTATETVTDLANRAVANNDRTEPHRLDGISEARADKEASADRDSKSFSSDDRQAADNEQDAIARPRPTPDTPTVEREQLFTRPTAHWDVYVDDFIGLCQGGAKRRKQTKRQLLHSLDSVFRGLDAQDSAARQEPASVKKMRKGDAAWATRKTVLGWIIDAITMTINLAPHRLNRLHEILEAIKPEQKRMSVKAWHRVLGELRSMAIAIPGARGLFSSLQEAFRQTDSTKRRLRLTATAHDFLQDFQWLARDLGSRPTQIAEVIPGEPATLGASDASGEEMGGIHFVPAADGSMHPVVWRAQFPHAVQKSLVTYDNPTGQINNSDLELAGSIAHADVLAQHADVRELTTHNCCDNTAAVFWQRKGSTTSVGPAAHLLRLQALHQRHHRYVPLHDYIPGTANVMADLASRSQHLSDSQLLSRFDSSFPQTRPWTLCRLRKPMLSALTCSLFKKRFAPESLLNEPQHTTTIGIGGMRSALKSASTPSCEMSATQCQHSKSLPSATEMVGSPPTVTLSDLEQWRTHCGLWARSSPAWGPKT